MKSLKRIEGINVVPLIDVMLVLLAIIMTISSFIAVGKIELNLPQGVAAKNMEHKKYEISITADKKFFLNQIPVPKDLLIVKLSEIEKEDSVSLKADKLVPYEEFVYVISILKKNEINNIAMVVEK